MRTLEQTHITYRAISRLILPVILMLMACNFFGPSPVTPTIAVPTDIDMPEVLPTETPPSAVIADDGAWVIFPEAKGDEIYMEVLMPSDLDLKGYWTPTKEEIVAMEAQLGGFLLQNADQFFHHPTIWEQLDEYHRQYIGLSADGKSFVYGNFFCDDASLDWLQEWVIVMDGGDCFFQTLYEVESDSFIRLQVNGEA